MASAVLIDLPSLGESIAHLGAEFIRLRHQLRAAHLEIARLRRGVPRFAAVEVASLRRRAAYYCHPDRGGDPRLMADLNRLLDAIAEWQGREE